jgi:hypothetical protein
MILVARFRIELSRSDRSVFMPTTSAKSLLPPNLVQRAAAAKLLINPVKISPVFAPQTIPATSLWYEANTLYFVGTSSSTVPYPVAFGSLVAFASYASTAISSYNSILPMCSAIPASLYPAPYSPQNLPGYGLWDPYFGEYQCCFACSPGLAGVCVPAVQAVAPTWIKWAVESASGIGHGVSVPSFLLAPGFGPLCPGLPSSVQTLCSSGMTTVAIAYLLLGSAQGWGQPGVLGG